MQEAAIMQQRQAAADGETVMAFVDAYMAAIKNSQTRYAGVASYCCGWLPAVCGKACSHWRTFHTCSWASQQHVGELFTEDARMVAADKQSFHGKPAIVRRLNQGVEQLAKMAGEQAALPTFQIEGPTSQGGGELVVGLAFKRGLQRMKFTLHFTMQQGKIAALRNTRS
jgi:hypothetical protein